VGLNSRNFLWETRSWKKRKLVKVTVEHRRKFLAPSMMMMMMMTPTLIVEAAVFLSVVGILYQTTRCHILKDSNVSHLQRVRENPLVKLIRRHECLNTASC
jgi:hypothetical protein